MKPCPELPGCLEYEPGDPVDAPAVRISNKDGILLPGCDFGMILSERETRQPRDPLWADRFMRMGYRYAISRSLLKPVDKKRVTGFHATPLPLP